MCVTAEDPIDLDGSMHCLMWPLSCRNIKNLLSLSAGFYCLFSIWTHRCSRFICFNWQLTPAGLSGLINTMAADTCHTSLETQTQIWNWLKHLPHKTQVAHCLQKVQFLQRVQLAAAADVSTMAKQLLTQQPSHDDTMHKKCYLERKRCPIRTALTFQCRHQKIKGFMCCKLKTINKCTCCVTQLRWGAGSCWRCCIH